MNIDMATATIIAGVSASIGAVIAAIVTFINAWLIRRSDERRQIRELAVKAAIEEWRRDTELTEKRKWSAYPLDLYLIHAMYFVQTINGSIRTIDGICNHIRKVHRITDAAKQEIENYSKNKNHMPPPTNHST